jgi:hypothetical protein
MKNRYEWNNVKEISNDKLYEVFTKATLSNKILIYRLLNNKRRKNLNEFWRKTAYQNSLTKFLEHIKNVLSPLDGYIKIGDTIKESLIKNEYEFWIVRGIAQEIGLIPLTEDSAINHKIEREHFNKAKEEMIKYLEMFKSRKYGVFSHYYDVPLIEEIEKAEYVKPPTKKEWELKARDEYLEMLYSIDVGKERALKIITSLEKWYKEKNYTAYNDYGRPSFNIVYSLKEEEKKLIYDLSVLKGLESFGYENINEDVKAESDNFLARMQKNGITLKNYNEKYSLLQQKEKQLRDKGFIETCKADDFFSVIRQNMLKKLYP